MPPVSCGLNDFARVVAKLGKGVRGKYYKQFQEATNVVVIDPDLTEAFPNAKAVNDALREVLARQIARPVRDSLPDERNCTARFISASSVESTPNAEIRS